MRSTRRISLTLAAVTAGLMTLTALPVAAATPQNHGQSHQSQSQQSQSHQGRDEDRSRNTPQRGNSDANTDDRHGRWNASWGARPPAPPARFTRTSDWNRHVHACQQRYRSYNPRTDSFIPRAGQTAICRL